MSARLRPRTPGVSPTPQPVRHGRARPRPGRAWVIFGAVVGVPCGAVVGIAAWMALGPFLTWLVTP